MVRAAVVVLLLVLLADGPGARALEVDWGGHLRGRGTVSFPEQETVLLADDAFLDGAAEFRLKARTGLGNRAEVEAHYEAVLAAGDTRRNETLVAERFPGLYPETALTDDRRLLDLSSTIDDGNDWRLSHRLDRLSVTLLPDWGSVTLGRQALTWGNGLLFNPMDLFNPFAPTDIERDYKVGDDMATAQFHIEKVGGVQLLYVPRRNPETGDVAWNHSSVAGKLHLSRGTTEFDLMAARHYEDFVAGVGAAGYLGGAAWRTDATWTFPDESADTDGFLALTANLDYSWVAWEKNFYGFVEVYHNGLGVTGDYGDALLDPDIAERLSRGEMHTLGRTYLAFQIQMEAHPLVNLFLVSINNMGDPSGVLQPHLVWDAKQNLRCTVGANLYYGEDGTEFGGFEVDGAPLEVGAADRGFVWVTWFF